jgi:hypothetical protein
LSQRSWIIWGGAERIERRAQDFEAQEYGNDDDNTHDTAIPVKKVRSTARGGSVRIFSATAMYRSMEKSRVP